MSVIIHIAGIEKHDIIRGCGVVVSRLVCIEKAPGSIPGSSTFLDFGISLVTFRIASCFSSTVEMHAISYDDLHLGRNLLYYIGYVIQLGPEADDSVVACSENPGKVGMPLAVLNGIGMVEFLNRNHHGVFVCVVHENF